MAQISAYISLLDDSQQQSTSSSPQTDPTAPQPMLTFNDNTIAMSPPQTQSISQYWLIDFRDNAYEISHLTSRLYLSVINNTLTLSTQAYPWTISAQRLGGFAIFASATTVLSTNSTNLTLAAFVADGGDVSSQRWQLRRTGYYLQNQDAGNFASVASANSDASVSLQSWQPFAQNSLASDGTRADAFSIWHLEKTPLDGQYRLYNEHSRTFLRKGGDGNLVVSSDLNPSNADLWQFAKNGSDIWLQCQDDKRWMGVPGGRLATIVPRDTSDKSAGWQLVSVGLTERGPLTSLPRFALLSSDQRIWSDNGAVDYAPDNSFQRWRSYTYGQNSIYINEASTKLLRNDGSTTDLTNTADKTVWWTAGDKNQSVSVSDSSKIITTVSNTGDLMASMVSVRIELSNGKALGVNSGSPVAEGFDRLSTTQVWNYLDWQQG